MRIMIYCQHVLGIGHFFRSMRIAEALAPHDVLFVEGGEPLNGFAPPPHVKRAFLPPLMMDATFKEMHTVGGDPDKTKLARRDLLMRYFQDFRPDALVIELFPFGRKAFGFELLPVLESIRDTVPWVKVICSLRDILVEKEDQLSYEVRVLGILNTYFNLLLIHSDPKLIKLDETFERTADIGIPVHYTGFIARSASTPPKPGRERVIVASNGGGKVGVDLLIATVEALHLLPDPDLKLRIFPGPFMDETDRKYLLRLAERDSRVALHPFSLDFPAELAHAELSISMAGYNTCMDILSARTRAIVYPFPQNQEQSMRAKKLADLGLVEVLSAPEAQIIASAIRNTLSKSPSNSESALDLRGAENTALLVQEYLGLSGRIDA